MSFTIPMCQYCGEYEVGTWANGSVNYCSMVCEVKAWERAGGTVDNATDNPVDYLVECPVCEGYGVTRLAHGRRSLTCDRCKGEGRVEDAE